MASPIPPTTVQRHHRPPRVPKLQPFLGSSPPVFTPFASFPSRNPFAANFYAQTQSLVDRNLRRSFPLSASNHRNWSGSCRATSPGSPSPPKLDPSSGDNQDSSSGIVSRFTKVKDAARIFFAVFFWMSLFFWSCVWDRRNDGRPNKGSRFRR